LKIENGVHSDLALSLLPAANPSGRTMRQLADLQRFGFFRILVNGNLEQLYHWLHPPTDSIHKPERRSSMEPRVDYMKTGRGLIEAMLGVEKYIRQSSIGEPLLNLVRLRASQINGCAYCIDMHWKDLRASGETEQRLYGLDAWQESPYYNERERAALLWTEAVTNVRDTHVPDAVYEKIKAQFNDKDLADLTLAVVAINSWNRLNIAARTVPGTYQPAKTQPGRETKASAAAERRAG
jgi:AhpD family alkylhydroperoxidase